VSLRIAGRTVARDYGWRNDRSTAIQVDDLNEFKVDVKLDTHIYNAIGLTDEELTLDIEDFTNQVLLPQTRAVAERLEGKIADKISGAAYPTGSVIDIATSGGFYNALVDGRKVLNDNNVPVAGRVCLVGTGVEQVVGDARLELGCDSISVMRLLGGLRAAGYVIDAESIFTAGSIGELAATLHEDEIRGAGNGHPDDGPTKCSTAEENR
ncbi:P22 phage major capsid protein family protein, partial [Rhodococcus opacus]|uniref:P22 phage major capsid protein family protein n=1 Tax=Rhodococcus opacus TaxID=37919 RepID=UPI002949DDF6